jgi:multidrug transporter EmrE-like cation transporter
MRKFFMSLMGDVDGQKSSKRFITLIAFLMMCVAFIANIFMDIPLQQFVWDGMMYIVWAGLGFTTLEKFSRSRGTEE